MNTKLSFILAGTVCAGLLVQTACADKPPVAAPDGAVATEAPIAHQGPAALAPEVKPAKAAKAKTTSHKAAPKKTVAKKAPAVIPNVSVPLVPGPATVSATRVNLRGQATTRSEVLGRLTNGQPVTVIEEINNPKAREDEPSIWAKIALPNEKHLWVSAQFVDAATKTVKVKKLNLRAGPGENFSVAGTLVKGDAVKDLATKDGWLEVEAPAHAFAYVAAAYLKQGAPVIEPPAVAVVTPGTVIPPSAVTPVEPPPVVVPTTTTTVPENPIVAPPPEVTPVTPVPAVSNPDIGVIKPAPVTKVEKPKVPLEPRIVEREGIVRRTFSIQAPSTFQLVNPETGKTVNYLFTNAKNLDLARYKGLRIIVTGEEGLDERWKNTPIITIQKIQVVE